VKTKEVLQFDYKRLVLASVEIEELLTMKDDIPRMHSDIISCWIVIGNDAEQRKINYDFRKRKILFLTTNFFPEAETNKTRRTSHPYEKKTNNHILSGYSHVIYPAFYIVSTSSTLCILLLTMMLL
jgi:hypothetical protein